MKKWHRIISMFLILGLLAGFGGVHAWADHQPQGEYETPEMPFVVASDNFGYGNTPTDAVTYTLYSNGKLLVKGSGRLFGHNWDGSDQPFLEYRDQITEIIIGEGITATSAGCFAYLTNLQKVSFPSTLTEISDYAFVCSFDSSVTTLTIPATVNYLGALAFGNYNGSGTWFREVIIENPNVEFADVSVFNGGQQMWDLRLCSYGSENNVSAYAESIGCYYVDLNLVDSYITGEIDGLGYEVDQGVLTLWPVTEGAGIPTSGQPWAEYQNIITKVVVKEGIQEIPEFAFESYRALTTVSLPDGLTYIGNFAFIRCSVLETVNLPDGLTGIGQQAFCGTFLKSVEIPASVTFVDACVFEDCHSLTDVLFRSDPDLPSFAMGNSVFRNCTSLEEIRVEEGHLALRSIDGALYFQLRLICYPAGRKDTQVRLPENTMYVGMLAFYGNAYVETVIFPATVQFIETGAFMACDGLQTLIFEGSAPEVHNNAFWTENSDLTISYPCGDASWEEARNTWGPARVFGNVEDAVWEMRHGEYEAVVTNPTCTEQGYTTHNCAGCGDSYTDSYVDPTGHSWGQWVVVEEPTEEEPGQKQRACEHCGHTETESIPRLGVVSGDCNGDDKINAKDVVLLRQHLAGWEVEIDPENADCNNDGKVNAKDVVLLRQYLAGWDVTLGSEA